MIAITTSSQKEAFPLAGRLSQFGTWNTWHRTKLHMRSRLAGGLGTAHHGAHKGYSDSLQHTGSIMSGQSHQDANMRFAYKPLKMFQAPNMTAGQTLHNSLRVPQTAYLQSAQTLCRRNSHAQTRERSAPLANSLIISKTCAAGGWEAKLGGSPSLKVPTKAANSRTPGMQKEKGHTANATLWDGCFSSHVENQQSTVLSDARSPDLAYGDSRNATLLYEQNHHLATQRDSYAELTREAYESFVGQSSCSDLALRRLSSSRATVTICRISSPAFVPILSTRASASREDSKGFSSLPSDWRRTISLRAAVTKNPAVDSPLNFAASISSRTSCGTRIDICLDLSLWVFVAMWKPIDCICDSVYTKRNHIKHLLCDSVLCNLNHTLSTGSKQIRHKNGEARRCDNTNGPLTTNDRSDIEVAMFDHTTHPQGRDSLTPNKFTWRFLALSRTDRKAKPCRLSVEAATERDARRILAPHFILSLAARLPLQGGVKITMPSTIEEIATPSTVSKIEMEVRYA